MSVKRPPVQIVPKNLLRGENGCTSTIAADDSFRIYGATNAPAAYLVTYNREQSYWVVGHKYFLTVTAKKETSENLITQIMWNSVVANAQNHQLSLTNNWQTLSYISTCVSVNNHILAYTNKIGAPAGYIEYMKNFMVIDLTATYGAGNEPTTVEQFKADYPLDYYEYNPQ